MVESTKYLDSWLVSMSDGNWEHHNGITIESTDNPGWMLSIDLPRSLIKLADLYLSENHDVEGVVKNSKLIIYSVSLSLVLEKTCLFLRSSKGMKMPDIQ